MTHRIRLCMYVDLSIFLYGIFIDLLEQWLDHRFDLLPDKKNMKDTTTTTKLQLTQVMWDTLRWNKSIPDTEVIRHSRQYRPLTKCVYPVFVTSNGQFIPVWILIRIRKHGVVILGMLFNIKWVKNDIFKQKKSEIVVFVFKIGWTIWWILARLW